MWGIVTQFLSAAIRQATPLTLAGIGLAFSEKAGVLNIGEEGIMLNGAFTGFLVGFFTQNLLLGLLGGIAGGVVMALIHAWMCIHCKANQTIVGLALNFFSQGLTSFVFLLIFGQSSTLPNLAKMQTITVPGLSRIPVIGPAFFHQNGLVYLLYGIILLSCFILFKTELGIDLVAVGENPRAADSAGLPVFRIQYLACLANGVLGGLAGTAITLGQLGYFQEDIISGKGYIALVVVILGRHHPLYILFASMIIGFAESLQFTFQTMGIPLPSQAFSMFPYVVAVIVLLFSIGRSSAPAGLGIPYERDKR